MANAGTSFHMSSDVSDTDKEGIGGSETEPVPAVESGMTSSRTRKVLIVEDAVELAEVIAATLERIDIQTFHETHVERALEAFTTCHPDVILLDISLPDKTGWKLLDEIKAQPDLEQPIVVVITAHGDPANRLMGKLQGVHSYLVKPFTPDEVEVVVERALRGGGAAIYSADDASGDSEGVDFQHTAGSEPDMSG
jgi:DNA-binding response OmpR family regulator